MTAPAIRVLLVEDETDIAETVRFYLHHREEPHFSVEIGGTLQAVLKRLAYADIDVILLDLGLPDSKGLPTFDAVHAAAPDAPVVLLTVLDDEQLGLEAVRRGAQDYLVKGQAGLDALPRVLQYAVFRRKQTEQLRRSYLSDQAMRDVRQRDQQIAALKQEIAELKREIDSLRHQAGLPPRDGSASR